MKRYDLSAMQWHRIATRDDRRGLYFLAVLQLGISPQQEHIAVG